MEIKNEKEKSEPSIHDRQRQHILGHDITLMKTENAASKLHSYIMLVIGKYFFMLGKNRSSYTVEKGPPKRAINHPLVNQVSRSLKLTNEPISMFPNLLAKHTYGVL